MGAKDDELVRIAAAGRFSVPALSELRNALIALAATMNRLAASPGWTGLSADAASDQMIELRNRYLRLERLADALQGQVDSANAVREHALARHAALPATRAPSWVHDTLQAFDFPGIPQPVDVAQGGVSIIENFLAGEREKAAAAIVAEYERGLRAPAASTESLTNEVATEASRTKSMSPADPDDTGTGAGPGGGYRPPSYVPTGPSARSAGMPLPGGGTDPHVLIGVDDPHAGVTPGGPGAPTTPGAGGGGAGLPAGAGAGVALTAGSTAAAMRLGAGAGMSSPVGAAARLGTGGLLGAGAPGAGATATTGKTAARGGSGLLGGAGGAGAAGAGTSPGDQKRRQGRKGLGGPIAPKLDDDDEYIGQAPGARAGERGEPRDEADAVGHDA